MNTALNSSIKRCVVNGRNAMAKRLSIYYYNYIYNCCVMQ